MFMEATVIRMLAFSNWILKFKIEYRNFFQLLTLWKMLASMASSPKSSQSRTSRFPEIVTERTAPVSAPLRNSCITFRRRRSEHYRFDMLHETLNDCLLDSELNCSAISQAFPKIRIMEIDVRGVPLKYLFLKENLRIAPVKGFKK